MTPESANEALLFFNVEQARTIDAIAARVIPGSPEDPGAREAGVVTYIDRALAGFHRDLQPLYRSGLDLLRERCGRTGSRFADRSRADQDAILSELDEERNEDGQPTSGALFFAVVRQHTIHGIFCDPAYGGNRDHAGWRLVGFPGAYWGYEPEHMEVGFDSRTLPIMSLDDLRRERASGGWK